MRKFISQVLLSTGLLLAVVMPATAAQTYTLDPSHTYVQWRIDHLGFSHQSGKWMASGTLELDKAHPDKSKVNVTVSVADIITGNPELDKHLKDKLFFDVDTFKAATFVSNKIVLTGKKTAKVTGTLTVHGVSKPVTLNVTFNAEGKNPITNKDTVGFSATTQIKRSDFGMTTLLPQLGDEVQLTIEAEGYIG